MEPKEWRIEVMSRAETLERAIAVFEKEIEKLKSQGYKPTAYAGGGGGSGFAVSVSGPA